jgi:hypothetical protein
MRVLRATAVLVGMRVLLIPDGQPIPDGAHVYGPATVEAVRRTFYPDRCKNGHPLGQLGGCTYQKNCSVYRDRGDFPMGTPA